MLVDFYHLATSPVERVLPSLCEKVLASGGRMLVVARGDLLERLDQQLWTYAPDSFLPHGQNAGDKQPILLSDTPEALNGAANIALADGLWREEALGFERVFYLFDQSSRDAAREVWRALKDKAEVECRYWKQDQQGKWVQGP